MDFKVQAVCHHYKLLSLGSTEFDKLQGLPQFVSVSEHGVKKTCVHQRIVKGFIWLARLFTTSLMDMSAQPHTRGSEHSKKNILHCRSGGIWYTKPAELWVLL